MSASLPSVTVVVVSYNAKAWLDQTLKAAIRSMEGLEGSIWVVDNASPDHSADWVKTHFPSVRVIANPHNPGFGAANNQVLHRLETDTALVLNPDTLLTPANLHAALNHMQKNPEVGSLGCRMIDGAGIYLPESKRGLPTPGVALAKMTGLHRLFPNHPLLGRYYWNFLKPNEDGPVEIHCGAYMLIRAEALRQTGGFDEAFFMYGEDIDLSYRILQAGYTNAYLGSEPLVHFKGESTKKGSLNYVRVFYEAMVIFAQKHFAPRAAGGFQALIGMGVALRAGVSVFKRLLQASRWWAIDGILTWGAMAGWTHYWEENHRYVQGGAYPDAYHWVFVPALIGIILLTRWLAGGYRQPSRIAPLLGGWALGMLAALSVYALLPEEARFSRALVVLGVFSSALLAVAVRAAASLFGWGSIDWIQMQQRRIAHVRGTEESQRAQDFDLVAQGPPPHAQWTIPMNQLEAALVAYGVTEIQFYPDELPLTDVVRFMASHPHVRYRFAYPDRGWVLASDSKETQGYQTEESRTGLDSPGEIRRKRQFDLAVAGILLPLFPFFFWSSGMRTAANNWWSVVLNKKTWIGAENGVFPAYPGATVLNQDLRGQTDLPLPEAPEQVYRTHWEVQVDLAILLRALRGKRL